MHSNSFLSVILVLLLSSCIKEKDPYEFPDDPPVQDPVLVAHFERDISNENWAEDRSVNEDCGIFYKDSDIAFFENGANNGRYIRMFLQPDTVTCEMAVSATTVIASNEITDAPITELQFDFTFTDQNAVEGSEIWLKLNYRELLMEMDISSYMREGVQFESGAFALSWDDLGEPVVQIYGDVVDPEFNSGNGNVLSYEADPTENFFTAELKSQATLERTELIFKYLRIWSYEIQ